MLSSSDSRPPEQTHDIHFAVRRFSGARAVRVIGGGNTFVEEHSHDWPVLSVYVMGDYRKTFEGGEQTINRPSVVLHGAGAPHANQLREVGLEQLDIEFDPRWLGSDAANGPMDGVKCWLGGAVAAAGTELLRLWSSPTCSEQDLARSTARFLRSALAYEQRSAPAWLGTVLQRLNPRGHPTAAELGAEVGLHPSWLAQAYRSAMGEGIRQTLRRHRVEYATTLLRGSESGAAQVALAAGFCDQSHMSRAFRQLLGRTPGHVRSELRGGDRLVRELPRKDFAAGRGSQVLGAVSK